MMNYLAPEIWLSAALLAALLVGTRLWRIAHTEEAQRLRLKAFRGAVMPTASSSQQLPWYYQIGIAVGPIIGVVEQQRLLKLLRYAGIHGRGSLIIFIAMKVCGAIFFLGMAWILVEWRHLFASAMMYRFAALGVGLMLGWRLPDILLNRIIKRRRLRLEQGMPDALDLLVICAEAGLSLNQAIEEISRQLRLSNKDVADEFATTSGEMRVLADFGKALDNMVERTGLDDLRSLTATLKQSLKFGTPLSESLRMIAGEMRAARHARIETRAARLPVILAIPMMLFILPCVMIVVGTPVILRIMDTFRFISFGSP
jgi:tight adherence protein C